VFTTGQRLVIPQEPVTRYDGAVRIVRTVKSPIFNADGQVTHTAGIMQDTTDHAQAEAKLQIFAEVVNTMQYGLYIWRLEQIDDPATLTAVAANPAAQRFTGVELRDHIGKKIGDVFQGINDTTSIPVAYAEIIRSGQARNLGEIAYDDGIISSVFATQGFPLPNNCIAIIFEDITERKRAEETMRQGMIQEEKIRAQQTALEELSTPLIPITDQIVVMPLIGALDSRRAQQVVGALLHGVSETRARTAILDITGVSVVDTQVANALIRAAQSAQLLGAQVMITGIRPEVAQTLIGLGVDLRGIITHSSLQSAIASAMARN
jgi:rsbT co-antagonist protein RsbR